MKTKMKQTRLWLMISAIALTLTLFTTKDVNAALSAPSPYQTLSAESMAEIEWKGVTGAYGYEVRISGDNKNWDSPQQSVNPIYRFTQLQAGTTYYVQVRTLESADDADSAWSTPIEICTAPTAVVSLTQSAATEKSLTFSWSSVYGANGYNIYIGNTSVFSNAEGYASTANTSLTINLKPDAKDLGFYVFVIPYRIANANATDGTRYVAGQLANEAHLFVRTLPSAPSKVVVYSRSAAASTYQFAYDISSCGKVADGYELKVMNASGKKIASKSTPYYNQNKLEVKNKKLYSEPFQYQVRPYINLNGSKKYGKWSKTYKFIPDAKAVKINRYIGAYTGVLTIKKVKGAQSYTVYWSTTPNNAKSWKVVAKNAKTTKINVKYDPNKPSSNCYYIVANKVKFGKKRYSSVKPKNAIAYYVVRRK